MGVSDLALREALLLFAKGEADAAAAEHAASSFLPLRRLAVRVLCRIDGDVAPRAQGHRLVGQNMGASHAQVWACTDVDVLAFEVAALRRRAVTGFAGAQGSARQRALAGDLVGRVQVLAGFA